MSRALAILVVLACATSARAQTPTPQAGSAAPVPAPTPPPTPVLAPTQAPTIDLAMCARYDLTAGAVIHMTPTPANVLATPIPWSEFEIKGELIDDIATVRALLEPTMQQLRTSLSTSTLPQIAQVTARFGYQLVFHRTQDLPTGTKLILWLAPLPLVKRVRVNVNEGITEKLLEDEVRRRMSVRVGSYLPWEPIRRQCAILEERRRIEEFLFDEGYFDAKAYMTIEADKREAEIEVDVKLKNRYQLDKVTISCPLGYERHKGVCVDPASNVEYRLTLSDAEIDRMFHHPRQCLFRIPFLCFGKANLFSRQQYQEDLQTLRQKFHTLGYPGVRVVTTDPRASINRKKETVNPVLTIDQRRRVQVDYVGYDPDVIAKANLDKQLTFDDAGSADEVEIAASARALTTYMQTRGFFDARVTWVREPKDVVHMDNVTFYIDAGEIRRVARVEFVGNSESVLDDKKLADLVATKPAGGIFIQTAAPTSVELITDQERIKEAYKREGYLDARVYPSASTEPSALGDAGLTAALLATDQANQLYVRFTIDEGEPTLVSRLVVQAEGAGATAVDNELCKEALGELARVLETPQIATRTDQDKCGVTIKSLKYRADRVATTRDRLRDYLFKQGRARAGVELTINPIGPHRVEARYAIKSSNKLKIGKVIIRGNFKTQESVIRGELGLEEGKWVTSDALAEGARKLRSTGLFEAVNIDMPDLDCGRERQCNSDVINAVVRVEERYIDRGELAFEGGYSFQNGAFLRSTWAQPNIAGYGLVFTLGGTAGTKLQDVEGTFRIPRWLVDRLPDDVEFTTELNALYRRQDTPRFGLLTTVQGGISLSRAYPNERKASPTDPTDLESSAHTKGWSIDYKYRVRIRNVDALRPIGSNMDESQVAVQTTTGSIGALVYWDHRINRNGQLSPLAPEDGSYAEASVAFAGPFFLGNFPGSDFPGGQDSFIKYSLAASKFFSFFKDLGRPLVLRFDARYDQGFPIGDEVLLPEVERYFGGGDSTVRGYDDDRLLTEVIQVGVPPLDNVRQIRVIPAGGNIRVLGTVDAQMRIYKFLAGAMFFDAGLITNRWSSVRDKIEYFDNGVPSDIPDIRPSVGMGLRALTPFGIGALEYAVPLRPQLGDNPRGRIHFYFAARAQF